MPNVFSIHSLVYFVIISGPITAFGSTVEIHGQRRHNRTVPEIDHRALPEGFLGTGDEFTEFDGCTSVVYAWRVTPAFTIPGFLRRQAERQLVGPALRGLRKQVESVSGS